MWRELTVRDGGGSRSLVVVVVVVIVAVMYSGETWRSNISTVQLVIVMKSKILYRIGELFWWKSLWY